MSCRNPAQRRDFPLGSIGRLDVDIHPPCASRDYVMRFCKDDIPPIGTYVCQATRNAENSRRLRSMGCSKPGLRWVRISDPG